jgi:hypothetical protein
VKNPFAGIRERAVKINQHGLKLWHRALLTQVSRTRDLQIHYIPLFDILQALFVVRAKIFSKSVRS